MADIPAGLALRPADPPSPPAGNYDFEQGLSGWHALGDAFANQPTYGNAVLTHRVRPSPLGGDYWDVPYPIGHHGSYWIGTAENRPGPQAPLALPDDSRTGTLTSDPFAAGAGFVSFLVGGSDDIDNVRVEYQVLPPANTPSPPAIGHDGDFLIVLAATGFGIEIMRREVWDVSAYAGMTARLRIVDQSVRGHINVDDFRFHLTDPAPGLIQVTDDSPFRTYARDPDAPVWGFADLHTHPMSHLGFGGHFFWGDLDGPMVTALAPCTPDHGPGGVGLGSGSANLLMWGAEGNSKGGLPSGHGNDGYPEFQGWPTYSTTVHQQMWIEWLGRAWAGGLRLIVALAVNNEFIAHTFGGTAPWDDASSTDLQLAGNAEVAGLRALVAEHKDFMEIAESPTDARRIIGSNKLAVILGVEVDSLGNFHKDDQGTPDQAAQIAAYVRHLHDDLGVRHVFPIHLANNTFGGCAIYDDKWNLNERYSRWDYFDIEPSDVFQFRLAENEDAIVKFYRANPVGALEGAVLGLALGVLFGLPAVVIALLAAGGTTIGLTSGGFYNPPDYASMFPGQGHVNARGLTDAGNYLLKQLMRRGMIIDGDHMSAKALSEVLALAEGLRGPGGEIGYPLAAGHTGFIEQQFTRGESANTHSYPAECNKTPEQVQRLIALGGLIGVHTHQADRRGLNGMLIPGAPPPPTPTDCPGSSMPWAAAIDYVRRFTGGPIAIGTDCNGLAGLPGPRFGVNAGSAMEDDAIRMPLLASIVGTQNNGVQYASPIVDPGKYRYQGYLQGIVYDDEDCGFWEAIGVFRTGVDPSNVGHTDPLDYVRAIALGLGQRPPQNMWDGFTSAYKAALLVGSGQGTIGVTDAEELRVYGKLKSLFDLAAEMDGPNAPLIRSFGGNRDFDINIDGVAHYGMLPDLLQDAKTSGSAMTGWPRSSVHAKVTSRCGRRHFAWRHQFSLTCRTCLPSFSPRTDGPLMSPT